MTNVSFGVMHYTLSLLYQRRGKYRALYIAILMSKIAHFRFDLKALLFCFTTCGFFFGAASLLVRSLFDFYIALYCFLILLGLMSERLLPSLQLERESTEKTKKPDITRFALLLIVMMLIVLSIAFSPAEPTVLFPYPFMQLYAISQGSLLKLFLIPALSYFIFTVNLKVATKRREMPLRVPVVMASMTTCTLIWFSVSAREAIAVFGINYFVGVASTNFLWLVALWLFCYFVQSSATYNKVIYWSFLFHVWLILYAFPLLIDPNDITDMSRTAVW